MRRALAPSDLQLPRRPKGRAMTMTRDSALGRTARQLSSLVAAPAMWPVGLNQPEPGAKAPATRCPRAGRLDTTSLGRSCARWISSGPRRSPRRIRSRGDMPGKRQILCVHTKPIRAERNGGGKARRMYLSDSSRSGSVTASLPFAHDRDHRSTATACFRASFRPDRGGDSCDPP